VKDFELLPHTADLKIRAFGTTLNELFKHALIGMFQSIHPKTSSCTYLHDRLVCPNLPKQHSITLHNDDLTLLLVDFLSEALYLSDIHNEAYLNASVTIHENYTLHASIYGIPIDGFEVVEIKAVTYHDLHIECIKGVWQADIVFDI
jgi:SHS2 domain-containing protein